MTSHSGNKIVPRIWTRKSRVGLWWQVYWLTAHSWGEAPSTEGPRSEGVGGGARVQILRIKTGAVNTQHETTRRTGAGGSCAQAATTRRTAAGGSSAQVATTRRTAASTVHVQVYLKYNALSTKPTITNFMNKNWGFHHTKTNFTLKIPGSSWLKLQ